jgi:hypothetical protein
MDRRTVGHELSRRMGREAISLSVALMFGVTGYVVPRLVSGPMPFRWADFAVITVGYVVATLLVEYPNVLTKHVIDRLFRPIEDREPHVVDQPFPPIAEPSAEQSEVIERKPWMAAEYTCSIFVALGSPAEAKQVESVLTGVPDRQVHWTWASTPSAAHVFVASTTINTANPIVDAFDTAQSVQKVASRHGTTAPVWLVSGSTSEYADPGVLGQVVDRVQHSAWTGSVVMVSHHGARMFISHDAGIKPGRREYVIVGTERPVELIELVKEKPTF